MTLLGGGDDEVDSNYDYRKEGITACVRERFGWLAFFFAGLIIAAVVVEAFEDVLKKEVELSYFVPLLIGHGGNTGSQSVATVIRALAMKQVSIGDTLVCVAKEAAAGLIMGAISHPITIRLYAITSRTPSPLPLHSLRTHQNQSC
mmetsp:Transcript_44161/g.111777  ORF Transcript_44161/g.111777 Transcript_44161/m.111777 type:complete len:146 (-) Transcript_44161:698-1135(-)